VLVEVGARCHGGDGLWLALEDECFGCNQAKCAIDSYLFPSVYAMMPPGVSIILVQCHPCIFRLCQNCLQIILTVVWQYLMIVITNTLAFKATGFRCVQVADCECEGRTLETN
jgi:hypothetical protein